MHINRIIVDFMILNIKVQGTVCRGHSPTFSVSTTASINIATRLPSDAIRANAKNAFENILYPEATGLSPLASKIDQTNI